MLRHLIHRHVGVRAEGMILAAAIWALIGVGVTTGVAPDIPTAWHLTVPGVWRMLLWLAVAAVAVVTAPSERWSNLGLALLAAPPAIHLLSYLWAWLMALIPGPPPGDPIGWYRAAFHAAMLALVVLLSHVPADVRAPLSGRRR